LLKLVAAILHLGNIKFVKQGEAAKISTPVNFFAFSFFLFLFSLN